MQTTAEEEGISQGFARDGAVVVGKLLGDAQVNEVREHLKRYAMTVVPRLSEEERAKTVRYEPDGTTLRVLYHLQRHDEFFRRFALQSALVDTVRTVAGWEPVLVAVESRHKPANIGTPVAMHQECWYHRPDESPRAILWIALDRVTEENGPVRFWLGTHRHGLLEHVANPPRMERIADADRVKSLSTGVLTGAIDRGWATLHDGLTVHDSPPNASPLARLAIACEYRRA